MARPAIGHTSAALSKEQKLIRGWSLPPIVRLSEKKPEIDSTASVGSGSATYIHTYILCKKAACMVSRARNRDD